MTPVFALFAFASPSFQPPNMNFVSTKVRRACSAPPFAAKDDYGKVEKSFAIVKAYRFKGKRNLKIPDIL